MPFQIGDLKEDLNNGWLSIPFFFSFFLYPCAVQPPVAGQTSDFVNQILENTGKGDPTGGLVGLRVPTLKV